MARIRYEKLPTEQPNPQSSRLDCLSVEAILKKINLEDRAVPGAVDRARPRIAQAVKIIVPAIRKGGRLFFAGAGTSGRLGVLEAAECPPTFNTKPGEIQAVMAGGKRAVFRSQEGAEDRSEEAFILFKKKLTRRDVLVGIAASGVTPFVHGALKAARVKKCKTILITCQSAPPNKSLIDVLIPLKVGPEIITGSTRMKAGTATKLALNMLTAASMIRLGKVYRNWMVDLQPRSQKLRHRALRMIQNLGTVSSTQAENYFRKAGRNVKVAILMARTGLTAAQARARLKRHEGFLSRALDKP